MKPVLQAILLADKVYEDKGTGKKVIAGTFNRLVLNEVDVQETTNEVGGKVRMVPGGMHPGSPTAYISLTEVRGLTTLEVRYVDLKDNSALLQTQIQLDCADPLSVIEIVVPLPPLPVPHPGTYALEVLCGNDLIGSYRVTVVKHSKASE